MIINKGPLSGPSDFLDSINWTLLQWSLGDKEASTRLELRHPRKPHDNSDLYLKKGIAGLTVKTQTILNARVTRKRKNPGVVNR